MNIIVSINEMGEVEAGLDDGLVRPLGVIFPGFGPVEVNLDILRVKPIYPSNPMGRELSGNDQSPDGMAAKTE